MRNPTSATPKANKTTPCCLKVGLKRGPWTPEEDQLLSSCIAREGEGRWRTLPKRAGLLRFGKSCRLRWMNYLRPSVKRGQIAPDEEDLILRLHRLLGNRWSLIAGRIPGRTDNEIKNYWNTHLSKKLISMGIDPRTHKPFNPSPNPKSTPHATSPPPAPNPSPNPSSSSLEESGGVEDLNGTNMINPNFSNKFMEGPTQIIGSDTHDYWQNSDGITMMMGLQDSRVSINNEDEIYGSDHVLSSFLNESMDEDMFLKQQQQNLLPSLPGLGCGGASDWNAEVPSQVGVDGEECSQFADQVGNCL